MLKPSTLAKFAAFISIMAVLTFNFKANLVYAETNAEEIAAEMLSDLDKKNVETLVTEEAGSNDIAQQAQNINSPQLNTENIRPFTDSKAAEDAKAFSATAKPAEAIITPELAAQQEVMASTTAISNAKTDAELFNAKERKDLADQNLFQIRKMIEKEQDLQQAQAKLAKVMDGKNPEKIKLAEEALSEAKQKFDVTSLLVKTGVELKQARASGNEAAINKTTQNYKLAEDIASKTDIFYVS